MIWTAWSGEISGTHSSNDRTTCSMSLWSSLCRITAYGGSISGREPVSGVVWMSGVLVVIRDSEDGDRPPSSVCLGEGHQRGRALDPWNAAYLLAQDRRDLCQLVHLNLTDDVVRPHHLVHLHDLTDLLNPRVNIFGLGRVCHNQHVRLDLCHRAPRFPHLLLVYPALARRSSRGDRYNGGHGRPCLC